MIFIIRYWSLVVDLRSSQSSLRRLAGRDGAVPGVYTVLNEKAADMISRLCSIVESLAEKLFLACSGGRGVATPGARRQFSGAGHLGYRALQLQVEIGHRLLRLVCAVSRSQRFVPDPRVNPCEVVFNHLRRDLIFGIIFVKLGGEISERSHYIFGDRELVRFEFVIV